MTHPSTHSPPASYTPPTAPAAGIPQESTMQERVAAIREVTNLFRMERTVYLVLTSTALLLLLASAGALLFKQGPQMVILAGLFGSSGIITVTIHRVIRMWERALDILNPRGITP